MTRRRRGRRRRPEGGAARALETGIGETSPLPLCSSEPVLGEGAAQAEAVTGPEPGQRPGGSVAEPLAPAVLEPAAQGAALAERESAPPPPSAAPEPEWPPLDSSRYDGARATDSTAELLIPVAELLPGFEEDANAQPAPTPVCRVVLDQRSPAGEQLSLLAARLRALGLDRRLRRIGVIATSRGEGTTTVALGLARGLAIQRDRRVLLLELELRRPGVDAALGLRAPFAGLCGYLEGSTETPLLRRHEGGFWVLSAGVPPSPPPDLAAARRLDVLLRAMDRVFDWIVVDCPPLAAAAEAAAVQERMDGLVFNVRLRHSRGEALRRAAAQLKPGKLVGVVLNAQRA